MCFTGKKIRANFSKDGNLEKSLKVEITAVKGSTAVISTGATISGKCKQTEKTCGHWIWNNLQIRVSGQAHPCCG